MRHPAVTREVSSAVVDSIQQDAILAEAARSLANRAITLAAEILENGSPNAQLNVIKALMPAVGRGLMQKHESDEMAEMRAQLEAMQQEMMSMRPDATVIPISGE